MNHRELDEEAIFHVAREISRPEARANYLDHVCAGDANLRNRVEALLKVYEQDEQFLKSAPRPATTVLPSEISERPGQRISRFKLLQKIGEGGFGVVFMAAQTTPYRRKVALKIIKPGMDTQAVVARFEAERQALAMMDHPHIARVLDGGATESGRPFFVMELINGSPITEYCDANQLSTRDRLELFITICQAVQHAHQKGIIHRDLKPSNILVTSHDGKPLVKVIDFGVAKAVNQELTQRTLFTEFGQMVGTLQYMSPEQAERSALDVDTRSDIYSLGVVLYELLTGETPHDAKRLLSAGYAEMQRIIREEDPPKPSTRLSASRERLITIAQYHNATPERLRKTVKGDLDWIVMKALEKDRARRYETTKGLANDVRRFINDEPVIARPPTKGYRFRKNIRRNKGLLITSSIVLCALVVGLVGTTVGLINSKRTQAIAAESEKEAKAGWERERRQAYEYGINLAYEAYNDGNRRRFTELLRAQDWDLRGFEWRLLQALNERLLSIPKLTVSGHVDSVVYSNNGKYLALTCQGDVLILDRDSGEVSHLAPEFPCNHVFFSAKGSYLIAGDSTPNVRAVYAWKLPGFKQVDIGLDRCLLASVIISPDENLTAGAKPDGRIEVRRIPTGDVVWTSEEKHPHIDPNVFRLAFSSDGGLLATGDWDERIRLWNVETGRCMSASDTGHWVEDLLFSPDGDKLVTVSEEGVKFWSVSSKGLTEKNRIAVAAACGAFSPDHRLIALGCSDHCVRIWDVVRSRFIARLLHLAYPISVAFSPDGQQLAAGGRDGEVLFWSNENWENRDACSGTKHWQISLAVSPMGVVALCDDVEGGYTVNLWNPETGVKTPLTYIESKDTIPHPPALAFDSKGSMLAIGGDDGMIRIWSAFQNRIVREFRGHEKRVNCLAFSPDGAKVVSGGIQPPIRVFDLKTEGEVKTHRLMHTFDEDGQVLSVAISSEGLLAAGGGKWNKYGQTRIWDLNDKKGGIVSKITHPQLARCVAFSPDGSRLVTIHQYDPSVFKVFEVKTGKVVSEIKGHAARAMVAMFANDGQRLITGSDDGALRFWDAVTAAPLGSLEIGERTRALAMLPGGNAFVSASREGWVRLWRAAAD